MTILQTKWESNLTNIVLILYTVTQFVYIYINESVYIDLLNNCYQIHEELPNVYVIFMNKR